MKEEPHTRKSDNETMIEAIATVDGANNMDIESEEIKATN